MKFFDFIENRSHNHIWKEYIRTEEKENYNNNRKGVKLLRFYRVFLLTGLLLLGMSFFTNNLSATEISSECGKCHDNRYSNPTFFMLPVIPDGSDNGSTVSKEACIVCHWSDIGQQHYPRFKTETATVNNVVYGGFKALDSIYKTPQYLHDLHNGPKRTIGTSCITCHGVVSCQSCHRNVLHENHYIERNINPKTLAAILTPTLTVVNGNKKISQPTTCATAECHNSLPNPVLIQKDNTELCSNCHTTSSSGHDIQGVHNSVFVVNPALDCSKCHLNDLTTEHQRQSEQNKNPLDCYTCHKSSKVEVISAIENNLKECDTCHIRYDHVTLHESTIDEKCQSCHKVNLSTEHLDNGTTQDKGLTCGTCHKNTRKDVTAAIELGNAQCTSCHTSGHNLNLIANVPDDILLHPNFSWSTPQDASLWEGESWLDVNYLPGGKRVISKRANLSTDELKTMVNDYNNFMTAENNGWVPIMEEDNGPGFTVVEFTKGNRRVKVAIYKGENYNSSPEASTGYRVDIIYK